jgi:hypothetical protein
VTTPQHHADLFIEPTQTLAEGEHRSATSVRRWSSFCVAGV